MFKYKAGHIINVRDYGYFRVIRIENGELVAKRCSTNSPYDFLGDQLYTIDPEDFKDEIEVITWYAPGFFDSLLG